LSGTNKEKATLAIETSEIVCGISIYFSDDKYFSSSISLKHSHSEKIYEIIESLFRIANIKPKDLDSIAISAGPGSFTGLRIGMSAAKGIAYGVGLAITPVPTYEAFAFQLSRVLTKDSIFIIANRVNREEVYFAKFQIRGNSFIFVDNLKLLKNDLFISGVDDVPVFGNAALLLGADVKFPTVPDPNYIAKWAIEYGIKAKTFEYDYLEPNYLKNFIIKEKNK
jgi:tRNA threonylcarbamoyladenosine biosynthesis protein TsaB